ncbi:MAG: hypothetical protein QW503_04440 [Sulfolobales archaeon]
MARDVAPGTAGGERIRICGGEPDLETETIKDLVNGPSDYRRSGSFNVVILLYEAIR